jgi:hypothetical protein
VDIVEYCGTPSDLVPGWNGAISSYYLGKLEVIGREGMIVGSLAGGMAREEVEAAYGVTRDDVLAWSNVSELRRSSRIRGLLWEIMFTIP